MSDLTVARFDEYFTAVHGDSPYPWQSRLARRVVEEDGWPDVIDLPTGVGKTAVLDIAVFALAVSPDVSPRRVVFVIDRRIVVDQVYERAQRISKRLVGATDGVLAEVNQRLRTLTDAERPLGVAALRGGVPIDGEWAQRPDQPWVMVSTVDQFGSRLLFRGYGVSRRMRPVHAGLAGNDCLVILDEVHLSRAFSATLKDACSHGEVPLMSAVNSDLLPPRFKVVEMSATPASPNGRRFELQDDDFERSLQLSQIARADKRATLVPVSGTRQPHDSVPKKVLELVKKHLRDDELSVGVIVNRVRTARETLKALQADKSLKREGVAAHLVTGRMRPLDKERVLSEISGCVDPERSETAQGRTVVVATQAIEVGADFSFDALISEVAPIDSLCQRFGRLDRRGSLSARRGDAARCWILGVESALNPKRPDPVYGDAARVTWEELQELAGDGEVEVGPAACLVDQLSEDALAPHSEAPLVLPTHVVAWTQTNPEPAADPPVTEFLHGKGSEREPEVSVVWRWDWSTDALTWVPPRPAECLTIPLSAARSWLQCREEVPVADAGASHVDHSERARGLSKAAARQLRLVRRWTPQEDGLTEALERPDDLRPGDLLVVAPTLGGLRGGTWDAASHAGADSDETDADEAERPVADLGDQAQLAYGTRATLRLDPRLFDRAALEEGIPPLPSPRDQRDSAQSEREAIDEWLAALRERVSNGLPRPLGELVERFATRKSFDVEMVQSDVSTQHDDYYVLVEKSVDPAVLDHLDDALSLTGARTTLRDHLEGVGARAADYGRRLGLSRAVVEDLRLAGELHDLGKVDCRFQAQLHGHDSVRLAESVEPLAKSLPRARTRRNEWPPVRHEFSSVALANSSPEVLDRAHDRDLVLHLVGSHHGYGRPLPTIRQDHEPRVLRVAGRWHGRGFRLCVGEAGEAAPDDDGDRVRMEAGSDLSDTPLALEMADRFWRTQERYGHHGLAWLEAIFRLADHQQSAKEAQSAEETG